MAAITKAGSGCPYQVIHFSGVDADRLAPGIVNVQGRPTPFAEAGLQAVRDHLEDRFDVVAKVVRQPTSLRLCLPFYLNYAEAERLHVALCGAFATAPLAGRMDTSEPRPTSVELPGNIRVGV